MKDIGKNEKDTVVGRIKESAGQILDDSSMELKGRLQVMKSKAGHNLQNVKEELAEKANDFIDYVKPDEKDKEE